MALGPVSFTVRPGERIALVGPSGAGKSTVFALILRLYDPDAGRILLDGADIRHCDARDVRRAIALVPQDPVIFAASVTENVRFGRPAATDDEVRAACRSAHALEFIERLPQGFDTDLGERGIKLSGGQRQRITNAETTKRTENRVAVTGNADVSMVAGERRLFDVPGRLRERAIVAAFVRGKGKFGQ